MPPASYSPSQRRSRCRARSHPVPPCITDGGGGASFRQRDLLRHPWNEDLALLSPVKAGSCEKKTRTSMPGHLACRRRGVPPTLPSTAAPYERSAAEGRDAREVAVTVVPAQPPCPGVQLQRRCTLRRRRPPPLAQRPGGSRSSPPHSGRSHLAELRLCELVARAPSGRRLGMPL